MRCGLTSSSSRAWCRATTLTCFRRLPRQTSKKTSTEATVLRQHVAGHRPLPLSWAHSKDHHRQGSLWRLTGRCDSHRSHHHQNSTHQSVLLLGWVLSHVGRATAVTTCHRQVAAGNASRACSRARSRRSSRRTTAVVVHTTAATVTETTSTTGGSGATASAETHA